MIDESDHGVEEVRVVTVNKPNSSLDQLEELLRQLLAGLSPTAPIPAKAPEVPVIDKLLQHLVAGPGVSGRTDGAGENASIILRGTSAFTITAPDMTHPAELDRHEVFFMWEIGSRGNTLPNPG